MGAAQEYEWPRPPVGGYVADDLDRLPDLPPHTELIDGSLVLASPQANFHVMVINRLIQALPPVAPKQFVVLREMTVTLGERDRPEPDLLVVRREAVESLGQTTYRPDDVVLAVEVVSKESEVRDRGTKPRKYAAAGIRHFWRIENEGDRPVVYVFELEPATGAYVATGVHHDRLELSVPFPIDIDLADLVSY